MEKKTISIGLVILAILAFSVWYLGSVSSPGLQQGSQEALSPTSTSASTPEPTKNVPKAPTPIVGGSTYKSLLTQKGNYQCDYDQVTDSGKSHNVIYLSDGKLRAEFRTFSGNTSIGNIAVYDGHYLYSWQEGTSVGTKTLVTSLGQLPTAIPADLTSGHIYGSSYESVGWKCHTWLVDKSLLVVPSYLKY